MAERSDETGTLNLISQRIVHSIMARNKENVAIQKFNKISIGFSSPENLFWLSLVEKY